MLADFVKALATLAQEAQKRSPKIIELPGDQYAIVDKEGVMGEVEDVPPARHNQQFQEAHELAVFCKDHHKDAVIFIGEGSITAVYDLDSRKDKATCPLVTHDQYESVIGRAGQPMNQQALIRFLRIDLKDCLPGNSANLIQIIRKINFRVGSEGEAAIDHGKHSLNKNIVAQVAGIDSIPEEIVLALPVFEGLKNRYTVRCAIEVFPETQTLAITPYPGELEDARLAALDDVRQAIAEVVEHANIYLGNP